MKKWHYPFLLFLIVATRLMLAKKELECRGDGGSVFGTTYHITCNHNAQLTDQIEQVLQNVDNSLSTFNKSSTISAINQNMPVEADTMFLKVFRMAQNISEKTSGAFDITVAPAVNAWGFGFKNSETITDFIIDSLKTIVGYEKVREEQGTIVKDDSRIMLDCSAIAKGYGCDMVAALFDSVGITDYMVEIGGEIVVKGMNSKGSDWRIGISKPMDDSLATDSELQTVLSLTDISMATSGNYRNYYYKDGKKYAHTINPATCSPVNHNLLSVTVLAKECAVADAYATAMMVMGLDKAMDLCDRIPEIEAYFIYQNETGVIQTCSTPGFPIDK